MSARPNAVEFKELPPGMDFSRSEFLGFIVYNEQHDDFLHTFLKRDGATSSSWRPSPEDAYKFHDLIGAQHFVAQNRNRKSLKVCKAFDTGDQIAVLEA